MSQMKEIIFTNEVPDANEQPLLESATGLIDHQQGCSGRSSDWLCSSPDNVGHDGRVLRIDLINTRMIFAYQSRKGEG